MSKYNNCRLEFSGVRGGNQMQKVIDNAVLKRTQEMEKNRKAYAEAEEWFRDTGYDRYFNKMNKLEAECDERIRT